jgi:hypothetical protein
VLCLSRILPERAPHRTSVPRPAGRQRRSGMLERRDGHAERAVPAGLSLFHGAQIRLPGCWADAPFPARRRFGRANRGGHFGAAGGLPVAERSCRRIGNATFYTRGAPWRPGGPGCVPPEGTRRGEPRAREALDRGEARCGPAARGSGTSVRRPENGQDGPGPRWRRADRKPEPAPALGGGKQRASSPRPAKIILSRRREDRH